MRGKWVLFSGVAILAAIGAGALSVLRKPAPPPVKKAAAPAAVAESNVIGDEISVMGTIQAAHIVPIPAPMDGVVETWEIELGQEVLAGQLLGRIRNSSLEATREAAQLELERAQTRVTSLEGQILAARLEVARTEADATRAKMELARLEKAWQRQQLLFQEGATPRLTFEKAERDYRAAKTDADATALLASGTAERAGGMEKDLQVAKNGVEERLADLESTKKAIDAGNITAPAEGVVLKLAADIGGEVSRSTSDLVQLAVDPALLEIVIHADKRVLPRVRPGLQALVIAPDVSSEAMTGEVKDVKDDGSVVVSFTSADPAVKHGMPGSVRIKLAH